jgi:glycine/D-amino acid oxidase-like deaminating enzyme
MCASTHAWGGNLEHEPGFRRPHMLDRRNGIALSGGYGGEGWAQSSFGKAHLADLILDQQSELTTQPWWVLGDQPSTCPAGALEDLPLARL